MKSSTPAFQSVALLFSLSTVVVVAASCASQPKSEHTNDAVAAPVPTAIPVAPYQAFGHRSVQATFAGQTKTLLFDTGGGITLVTPEIASDAGCTPFGQLSGFRMRGERVDFPRCDAFSYDVGTFSAKDQVVGVFDVNQLIPPDWPRLGGMVTLSTFDGKRVKLRLGQGEVIVDDPEGSARTRGEPMNLVRQASGYSVVVLVPSPTPEGTLWLELDSGSDAPLMLSPSSAKALGIDLAAEGVVHQPAVAAAPGVRPRPETWKVPKVTFTLPGIGPVETSATVLDIIYDGNIGAPLIEKYEWTLDLKHQRVQVEEAAP